MTDLLKDIRIHQDPQILIQMVLDRVLGQATGTVCIPIVMINIVTSNGHSSEIKAETFVARDGQILKDEILETWEACRYLKISRPKFLDYVQSNRISATKIGKGWKVFRSELDRFLKEG